VKQIVEIVSEHEKYTRLIQLLEEIMDGSRLLIFLETKKKVVTKLLGNFEWMDDQHSQFMEIKAKLRETGSYQNLRLQRALL